MLLTNVDQINQSDCKLLEHHEINDGETWRVSFMQEVTNVKFNQIEVEGFESELDDILNYLFNS